MSRRRLVYLGWCVLEVLGFVLALVVISLLAWLAQVFNS